MEQEERKEKRLRISIEPHEEKRIYETTETGKETVVM